jgi:hypothetical protein
MDMTLLKVRDCFSLYAYFIKCSIYGKMLPIKANDLHEVYILHQELLCCTMDISVLKSLIKV